MGTDYVGKINHLFHTLGCEVRNVLVLVSKRLTISLSFLQIKMQFCTFLFEFALLNIVNAFCYQVYPAFNLHQLGLRDPEKPYRDPKRPVYAFTETIKEVRIGPLHQAEIPEAMQKTSTRDRSILQKETYPEHTPFELVCKCVRICLWNPLPMYWYTLVDYTYCFSQDKEYFPE